MLRRVCRGDGYSIVPFFFASASAAFSEAALLKFFFLQVSFSPFFLPCFKPTHIFLYLLNSKGKA